MFGLALERLKSNYLNLKLRSTHVGFGIQVPISIESTGIMCKLLEYHRDVH